MKEKKTLNANQTKAVQMSADGSTADEIAKELGVTSRSVEYYLKDACDIVGAKNKPNLVAICLRKKLIT